MAGPTITSPGAASFSRRCAVLTTSPITVGSPPARIAPDEHLAGVHPDPHLHADAELGRERGQRLVHAQRGPHRPLGVVLVRDRRAEQGHDLVADDLVEAAAEVDDVGDERARSSASTRRFTCSGSLPAESAVKPTRSAISTVTRRRSSAAAIRR